MPRSDFKEDAQKNWQTGEKNKLVTAAQIRRMVDVRVHWLMPSWNVTVNPPSVDPNAHPPLIADSNQVRVTPSFGVGTNLSQLTYKHHQQCTVENIHLHKLLSDWRTFFFFFLNGLERGALHVFWSAHFTNCCSTGTFRRSYLKGFWEKGSKERTGSVGSRFSAREKHILAGTPSANLRTAPLHHHTGSIAVSGELLFWDAFTEVCQMNSGPKHTRLWWHHAICQWKVGVSSVQWRKCSVQFASFSR